LISQIRLFQVSQFRRIFWISALKTMSWVLNGFGVALIIVIAASVTLVLCKR